MTTARRRGIVVGQLRKLTPHQIVNARQLIEAGAETQASAAVLLCVDPVRLRRAFKA